MKRLKHLRARKFSRILVEVSETEPANDARRSPAPVFTPSRAPVRTASSPWRAIFIVLAGAVATALYFDAFRRGMGNMTDMRCGSSDPAPQLRSSEDAAHSWAILANAAGILLTIAAAAALLYERSRWWYGGTVVALAGGFAIIFLSLLIIDLRCM